MKEKGTNGKERARKGRNEQKLTKENCKKKKKLKKKKSYKMKERANK